MVKKYAAADPRRRIDVGLEHRRGAALQIGRKILAALAVKPMRQTMGLDRVESLEIKHRIEPAIDRRIAVDGRHDIGAERRPDR